jgi:hypothetical protein
MKSRECGKCGASVAKNETQCTYCGTWYEGKQQAVSAQKSSGKIISLFNLPQGVGEFGISHNLFFSASALIIIAVYLLGWFFEDPVSWLDNTAVLIWMGLLPILTLVMALLWRTDRKVVMIGLAISFILFTVHVMTIWAIRGSLWDDHVGIAAMVGAGSFAGWLFGRLGHIIIRWRKMNK